MLIQGENNQLFIYYGNERDLYEDDGEEKVWLPLKQLLIGFHIELNFF